MKDLWRRDRHYVATPNMEVWERLVCLAPDAPDGWSFPNEGHRLSFPDDCDDEDYSLGHE
jgi:hypothetical protein